MKTLNIKNLARLLAISAALMFTPSLFAQEEKTDAEIVQVKQNLVNQFDNSVGLRYSNISGYGLNYTRRIFDYYSICFSGIIHYYEYMQWEDLSKAKTTKDRKDKLYNIGVELQRDMLATNNSRIFALIGGYYATDDNRDTGDGVFESRYVIGIGFGLQWYFHKNISGNINVGYKFDNIDKEDNGSPSVEKKTAIGAGVGLSFHF
jgi:hypothetical protein